jgi:hypothetical protein
VNPRCRFHRQAQKALTGLLGDILADSAAVFAYLIRGISNVSQLLVADERFSSRPGLVTIPKRPLENGLVRAAGIPLRRRFRHPLPASP